MERTAGGYTGNRRNNGKANNIKIRKTGVRIKRFLYAVFIITVVTAIFFFLTNKYFFKIKNITIGENDRYSYDEILKASGIAAGEELYGLDLKKAKENIKQYLTYTESVNITQIPPSTVSINIKTENGLFGIMLGGDYYIISPGFRVVDKIKVVGSAEAEFKPPDGIVTFETDTVKRCYVGEQMEFEDSDIFDFLKEVAELLKDDAGMVSLIKSIDVTNKFGVVMNYSDKFLVRFGVFENITVKMLNSVEIINQLPDYAEGVIDMTDGKVASFRYDENISKLYSLSKEKRSSIN